MAVSALVSPPPTPAAAPGPATSSPAGAAAGGDVRCLVVVLCGLPAAGKSTASGVLQSDGVTRALAERVAARVKSDAAAALAVPVSVAVEHVAFDAYFDAATAAAGAAGNAGAGAGAAAATPSAASFDAELWARSRAAALDRVDALLKPGPTPDAGATGDAKHPHPHASHRLVVVDDNMPYRSMRYAVFQRARTHRAGYVCLYFPCTVALALQRHAARVAAAAAAAGAAGAAGVPLSLSGVTAEHIERMAQRLEPPPFVAASPDTAAAAAVSGAAAASSAAGVAWEPPALVVDTTKAEAAAAAAAGLAAQLPVAALANAWYDCVPRAVVVADAKAQALSREQTQHSLLHQSDVLLRRAVTARMKPTPPPAGAAAASAGTGAAGAAAAGGAAKLAAALNAVRKQLLTELKDPHSLLTASLPAVDSGQLLAAVGGAATGAAADTLLARRLAFVSQLFAQRTAAL